MKPASQYGTRPARLLRNRVSSMPTDVMKRIDTPILITDEEEVPPKHLHLEISLATRVCIQGACLMITECGGSPYLESQIVARLRKSCHKAYDMPQLNHGKSGRGRAHNPCLWLPIIFILILNSEAITRGDSSKVSTAADIDTKNIP